MKEVAVGKYMSAFNKENIQIARKNDIALFASEKPKIVFLNLLQKTLREITSCRINRTLQLDLISTFL